MQACTIRCSRAGAGPCVLPKPLSGHRRGYPAGPSETPPGANLNSAGPTRRARVDVRYRTGNTYFVLHSSSRNTCILDMPTSSTYLHPRHTYTLQAYLRCTRPCIHPCIQSSIHRLPASYGRVRDGPADSAPAGNLSLRLSPMRTARRSQSCQARRALPDVVLALESVL